MNENARLWTRPYTLLCGLLFAASIHGSLLDPIIPLYVNDVSGSVLMAGLALAAFSVTSFMVRPIVGYAVDRFSPILVLLVGTAGLAICGTAFLIPFLVVLFLANAVRGLSWACMYTSCY